MALLPRLPSLCSSQLSAPIQNLTSMPFVRADGKIRGELDPRILPAAIFIQRWCPKRCRSVHSRQSRCRVRRIRDLWGPHLCAKIVRLAGIMPRNLNDIAALRSLRKLPERTLPYTAFMTALTTVNARSCGIISMRGEPIVRSRSGNGENVVSNRTENVAARREPSTEIRPTRYEG